MRRGFTLIEVLVATVLLGMLVTILTMIFNQSSIAWSTGVASVTSLGDMREKMALYADVSENALLSDDGDKVLLVKSVWDDLNMKKILNSEENDGQKDSFAGRALQDQNASRYKGAVVSGSELVPDPAALVDDDKGYSYNGGNKNEIRLNGENANGQASFLVGVHSYGPDGMTGGDHSWDDITTMPEEVVK